MAQIAKLNIVAPVFAGLLIILMASLLLGATGFAALFERRDALLAVSRSHPLLVLGIFVMVYAAATACLAPGTLWLAVLAGFLFGPAAGALATLFASTIGACAVFFVARTWLRPGLEAFAGRRLARFSEAFGRNAFAYMLFLRFMPMMPYPLANLAPALLGARFAPFLLATPLGLAPTVIAYAVLGDGLTVSGPDGELPDLVAVARSLAPGLALLSLVALAAALLRSRLREAG